jgi:Na+/H+ antiporter NhaC
VAILPCIILAILLSEEPLTKALSQFIDGIGNNNIITMCLIYLLAGAFAAVAKATGGVEATVALGLNYIPGSFLVPGFFIITAFIATAMGTSMGTLAAISPVAVGITQTAGIDPSLMAGAILSGALFGDNLSIISDTTIASTRTQGCEMSDKFKENLIYAIPSALIAILFFSAATNETVSLSEQQYEIISVIPYLIILILAVSGLNVFVVLTLGILIASGIGIYMDTYSFMLMAEDIYSGFVNMQEIFLLSMLIGGLAALMYEQGGLAYISQHIENIIIIVGKRNENIKVRAAEAGIGFTASLTNLCIANNTVAILISSGVAKALAKEHNIPAKRSASILDIFTCIIQGIIPYGAQALLVSAAFEITPLESVSYVWYCMILSIITLLFIFTRKRDTNLSINN